VYRPSFFFSEPPPPPLFLETRLRPLPLFFLCLGRPVALLNNKLTLFFLDLPHYTTTKIPISAGHERVFPRSAFSPHDPLPPPFSLPIPAPPQRPPHYPRMLSHPVSPCVTDMTSAPPFPSHSPFCSISPPLKGRSPTLITNKLVPRYRLHPFPPPPETPTTARVQRPPFSFLDSLKPALHPQPPATRPPAQ